MGFLDLKYEAFGLDINDLSLKIVKLKKKRGGFFMVSFNEVKIASGIIEGGVINDENALAKIIRYACKTVIGKKLKTKYVVASLPEEKSFLQVIQMPEMSEDELKLAVPLEAGNYIPMAIGEVYLDFQTIPPVKEYFTHPEVMIVAMPKKVVDAYISCFKKAGLTPIVLEAESEAIARALLKKDNNPSLTVLIDFGENQTSLVVHSGHSVRFTCSIPISSQMLTRAISEELKIGMHDAERIKVEYGLMGRKHSAKSEKVLQSMLPILNDLAGQIKKYLNFYRDHSSYEYLFADGKKEKVLLCGGGAELKGLADFMAKELGIPTEIGVPSINLSAKRLKNFTNKSLLPFTTAIGLALRELDIKL